MVKNGFADAALHFGYLGAAAALVWIIFGPLLCAISLLLGIPAVCVVVLYRVRISRREREAAEAKAVVSALSVAYTSIRHNGKPLLHSLDRSVEFLERDSGPLAYRAFSEVARRMRLGQDLDAAARSVREGMDSACLAPLYTFAREYGEGLEPAASLRGILDDDIARRRRDAELSVSSSQRRVTVGMALGTIVPSFLIFVFVGYSMVYYSLAGYFAFAVALLVALPCAYSVFWARMPGGNDE